jgi:hypothetical protein
MLGIRMLYSRIDHQEALRERYTEAADDTRKLIGAYRR